MNWLYWKAYGEHTKAAGRARAVRSQWGAAAVGFLIFRNLAIPKKPFGIRNFRIALLLPRSFTVRSTRLSRKAHTVSSLSVSRQASRTPLIVCRLDILMRNGFHLLCFLIFCSLWMRSLIIFGFSDWFSRIDKKSFASDQKVSFECKAY